MKKLKLPTLKIAECSTGDITFEDSLLLNRPELPRVHKNRYGYIIYINLEAGNEQIKECRAKGFSKRFLELLKTCQKKKIGYLVIDQDAGIVSKEDPSWNKGSLPTITSEETAEIQIEALEEEELKKITRACFYGLYLDIQTNGEEQINAQKNPDGEEFKNHIKAALEKAGLSPK